MSEWIVFSFFWALAVSHFSACTIMTNSQIFSLPVIIYYQTHQTVERKHTDQNFIRGQHCNGASVVGIGAPGVGDLGDHPWNFNDRASSLMCSVQ